jgi:hypothetical protein
MIDRPRRAGPGLLLAAAALAATASGCGTVDVPVLSLTGGTGGADAGDGGAPSAAPDGALPAFDTLAEYCSGSGPPMLIDAFADGGAVLTCPEQLAQRAFLYALCTCNNYVNDHALTTDSFDGTQGAYDPSTALRGGSVGVNGELSPSGPMQIGGSLWASDSTPVTTMSGVNVAGDLHAEGEMLPTTLTVMGNAWMANGIQASGNVTVDGTLDVPTGAPFDIMGTPSIGTRVTTPFPSLAPACDCQSSEFVDVAGVVATYRAHNDDMALSIPETMFQNVQSAVNMTLPCGRIYLSSIGAAAPIHLTVTSHVAIFVDGDISTSDFEIDVPTGGELDLFVAGSITVQGSFLVGSTSNPARARTYVGGSTVNLQGSAAALAGNLYAPGATITLGASASTTLYGSIFASSLSAGADLAIHYDQAILTQSSEPACPAPPSCSTCSDCGGQACNSGTCGSCVPAGVEGAGASSQCCPPLVCGSQGICVSDIVAP